MSDTCLVCGGEGKHLYSCPRLALSRETTNDTVNHPKHYNAHPSGVECIDIIEHMTFNVGTAMKYLWRAGLKHPDKIEDLEKAVWYTKREIEKLKKEKNET